jgi:hypothetical protein
MTRFVSRVAVALASLYLLPIAVTGQGSDPWEALTRPRTLAPKPTGAAISPADLMSRVYRFADDSMEGRVLDSRGNVKGTEYLASELGRLGLTPAGDRGSFLQAVPLGYRRLHPASIVTVKGKPLLPWTEYIPRDQGRSARTIDGIETVYGGTWGMPETLIAPDAAAGKVVVLSLVPAGYSQGIPGTAARAAVAARFPAANGLAVVGFDLIPRQLIPFYRDPGAGFEDTSTEPVPAFLYISRATAGLLFGAPIDSVPAGTTGSAFEGNPRFVAEPLRFPAHNVVAVIPGSDPALRNEYVVLGAHHDHIGTAPRALPHDSMYVLNHRHREGGADDPPPRLTAAQTDTLNRILAEVRRRTGGRSARPDSIYNGADDDASGSMALLEIAEAFASRALRPKRSLLFIWHVGEEQGLFGSEHFTEHPGVPRESIVAQLNLDMVGRGGPADVAGNTLTGERTRGGPDYLQLIGSRRLATELGNLAEEVNRAAARPLVFDYSMDANGHPQNIYCRSDHWNYARFGIPIIFFSTGGHADYHQITDEPQYLDYDRLSRVTTLVASLAERIADLDHRVVVDQPKPDPNRACRQ